MATVETPSAPTRRDYVRYGGAAGASLLAGCLGEEGEPADGQTTGGAGDDTPDGSYSVTMAPMGSVQFESAPERVYTGLPNTADMAVAAGRADAVTATYYPEYHGTLLNAFYERLPGVSFEWGDLTDSWGLDVEGFYDLDSDVHLTDPAYASTLDALDPDAVAEIGDRIAPWFGNYYSDRRRDPPSAWAADYAYYDLWEIFRRVAGVFRAGERAEALAAEHGAMRATIDDGLPPVDDRPSAAMAFPGEDGSLWIYRLNGDGFLSAHTRPLGATDAFADLEMEGPQTQVDYEGLLEADPDALLLLFTMSSDSSIAEVRERLADHPVASEVAAVRNDRVYAQGVRYQGPLVNLFQLEMTAKQLYPDAFGEWPGYVDGEPYPEIPADEQLFDRDGVAGIVAGDGGD